MTTNDLEKWINRLGCGRVARKSTRALVITFFKFARQKGCLTKNQPTAAEAIPLAKEPPAAIGIFTPDQMKSLPNEATGVIQLYLAMGAFSGFRQAELMRFE